MFILVLALTDLLTSAVCMPYTILMEALNYQLRHDALCKLYYFVITCSVPFSVFIMVAIATDRYLCICRPQWHLINYTRARNVSVVLLLLAVMIGVVMALFHGVYLDFDSLNDVVERKVIEDQSQGHSPPQSCSNETFGNDCTNGSSGIEAARVDFHSKIKELQHLVKEVLLVCNEDPRGVFTETCLLNQVLLPGDYFRIFRKIYLSFFAVCLMVIFVLYIFIFRTVLASRKLKFRRESRRWQASMMASASATGSQTPLDHRDTCWHENKPTTSTSEAIALQAMSSATVKNIVKQEDQLLEYTESPTSSDAKDTAAKARRFPRNPSKRLGGTVSGRGLLEKYFLANIRTAAMLFVVTFTFIICYLPSWLMAFKVMDLNVVVFYLYFSNHIVNPVIYAFMNPTFRKNLKSLLRSKRRNKSPFMVYL